MLLASIDICIHLSRKSSGMAWFLGAMFPMNFTMGEPVVEVAVSPDPSVDVPVAPPLDVVPLTEVESTALASPTDAPLVLLPVTLAALVDGEPTSPVGDAVEH